MATRNIFFHWAHRLTFSLKATSWAHRCSPLNFYLGRLLTEFDPMVDRMGQTMCIVAIDSCPAAGMVCTVRYTLHRAQCTLTHRAQLWLILWNQFVLFGIHWEQKPKPIKKWKISPQIDWAAARNRSLLQHCVELNYLPSDLDRIAFFVFVSNRMRKFCSFVCLINSSLYC